MKTMASEQGKKLAGIVILPILLVSLFFLCGFSQTEVMAQEGVTAIEKLLPPDTIVFAGTEDVSLAREYGDGMPLMKILKEQEVIDFLEKPKQFVEKALKELKGELSKDEAFKDIEIDLNRFFNADIGQAFFALTHFALPEEGTPGQMALIPDIGIVFGAEYRNPEENLIQFAKNTLVSIANAKGFPIQLVQEEYQGISYEKFNLPIPVFSPCIFKVGKMDVFASSHKSMTAILDRHLGLAKDSLATRSDYANGFMNVNPGSPAATRSYVDMEAMSTCIFTQLTTAVQLYLTFAGARSPDGEQALPILQDFPAKLEKLKTLMGFESAGSLYASEISRDGIATYKTYMTFNGPPKGLWALSPEAPFSNSKLKMIPKEAVSFSIGQFDMAGLYDLILEGVKIVDESSHAKVQGAIDMFCSQLAGSDNGEGFNLRQDLIGSLGTEMVVYKLKSKGMAMMGAPPVFFLVEAKDYDRFIGSMDTLFSGLKNIEPEVGSFFSFKGTNYEGHDIHYIQLQNLPMVPFQPSFAKVGDYIAFSFGINDMKKLIKAFGKSETSILDNEDFMSFFSRLPEGKELLSLSYTNVREEFGGAYEQITPMIPLLTMGLPADLDLPIDFMLLPTSECITKHLFSSIRASYRQGDGCMVVKYGPFGPEMGRVVVPLMAGAVAGLVLYAKADETMSVPIEADLPDEAIDPALQAKKDLGSLGGACMVFKIEHGNFPENLEDLLVPTEAYPAGFYPPKKLPVDPWGNAYHYALKTVKPLPKIVAGGHQYMIWSLGPNGVDEFGEGDDIIKLK